MAGPRRWNESDGGSSTHPQDSEEDLRHPETFKGVYALENVSLRSIERSTASRRRQQRPMPNPSMCRHLRRSLLKTQ